MFAKSIITSDAFLDMPMSARCLYFSLGMFADDDGFVNSPKSIMRQIGATSDDMNVLLAKKFLLAFDSGVIVIKHWRIHNYIRSDRYKETNYKEEKATLSLDENGSYTRSVEIPMGVTVGIPMVDQMDTQDRIGKDRIGKDKNKYGEFENVFLTDEELSKLKEKFPRDWKDRIENLSIYLQSKGKKYKSHYATILSWARKEEAENPKPIKRDTTAETKETLKEMQAWKKEEMPKELRDKLSLTGMFGG